MHVIKQTFKIVLNHKYSIFALLFIQAHIFEENKKTYLWVGSIEDRKKYHHKKGENGHHWHIIHKSQ